jgi:peroxiredoxin Q/BCP
MLKTGDTAPDFSLPDQEGRTVTLGDLLDDATLILFFYPADFTPVCTREACLFRDANADLAATGIRVAGISPNDSDSHARFGKQHALGYTLLADSDKRVIRAYGVDGPLGIGVRRATFLIDRAGLIQRVVRADLRLTPHSALIREVLEHSAANRNPSD